MKKTLSILQLVNNGITEAETAPIADLCRESSNLKVLLLDYNHIGDGCCRILQALCENPQCNIQKLSMKFCEIKGTVASKQFGLAMMNIKTLRYHIDLKSI